MVDYNLNSCYQTIYNSRGLGAVDTILHLDKLRQIVAVKEKLRTKTSSSSSQEKQHMRKTMSVPNFVQMSQSFSLDNLQSIQMRSSISFHDTHELSGRYWNIFKAI